MREPYPQKVNRVNPFQKLRALFNTRQASLRAQYLREIAKIPQNDVVMRTRVKYKYRQLGLEL